MADSFSDLEDFYAGPLGRRYRWQVWEAARPWLEPLAGRQILDAGCGAGHYSILLAEAGAKVTGIDPDSHLLARAQGRIPVGQFVAGSIEALPFPDGAFARAFCSNVLEFVRDQAKALAELRRVAPGGAVVCVLNRDSLWGWQQQLFAPFVAHPYYRGRFFRADEFAALAASVGWQVRETREILRFPPLPVAPLLDWFDGRVAGGCWLFVLE